MTRARAGLLAFLLGASGASRSLAWGDVPPLVRLRPGPGWRVLRPGLAWGTRLTVDRLTLVLERYHRRFPEAPPVWVHDISGRWGGKLRWHRSHRDGRDVDIRLPRRFVTGYVDATPRTLHVRGTWFLVLELVSTCDVEFIMLDRELQRVLYRYGLGRVSDETLALLIQYPRRLPHRHPGNAVVRHYPRHRNHMHVRFRRAGAPLEQTAARRLCGLE